MEAVKRKSKVAIVGFCQPHREWVPYEDPDLEIWGLNRGYIFMQRADRWFEMHGRAVWAWDLRRPGNHIRWLQKFPGPVYMHEVEPEIPKSIAYPFVEVAEDLGALVWRFSQAGELQDTRGEPYLTSTIAQQIALAIHEGYEEIGLYGIDLSTTAEYAWQKPGVEYLLGVAVGRGIRIRLPDECPLLKGAIYGRGYLRQEGERVSPEQWAERIKALEDQREQILKELEQAQGARRELQYLMGQMTPGLDHELLDQRRKKMDATINAYAARLYQNEGGLNETLYWAHQTPAGQDPREALGQLVAQHGLDGHGSNGREGAEGPQGYEMAVEQAGS